MSNKPNNTNGGVQSLNRGLLLLERIAESSRNGITLTDLSLQVGLAASTTHRLLNTLEQAEFIKKDPELGLWYIGLKAFSTGNAFLASRDIIAQARPYMKRLMEQTGETINLAIENNGTAVYVSQVECLEMMRMIVRLGSKAPIHGSAVGKALLAWMPEQQMMAALKHQGLQSLTPHTMTTMAEIQENLALVKQRGYATDLEEHTIGLNCVASAIFNEHGEPIAALSLSGPKARVTFDRLLALGVLVHDTAIEITNAIGGKQPSP